MCEFREKFVQKTIVIFKADKKGLLKSPEESSCDKGERVNFHEELKDSWYFESKQAGYDKRSCSLKLDNFSRT